MSETVDAVQAFFGGRQVRFRLDPQPHVVPQLSPVASLEKAIGSPYAAYRRFLTGSWLPTDVGHVLRHAYPGAVVVGGMAIAPAVDAVLSRGRIIAYAVLAQRVLEAFLAGLPADKAVFDERAPLDV